MGNLNNQAFNTNVLFSGGAGMFIQYHDIIKPTYLMVIYKLLMSGMDEPYGLPIKIIKNLSVLSLVEWYLNRRYQNPLRCLDYLNKIPSNELNDLLLKIMADDNSLYRISPIMNMHRMLSIYSKQRMTFPVYLYTETEEPHLKEEARVIFNGIPTTYVFGDITGVLKKCDQNFTYVVSDVGLYRKLVEQLSDTYSHILLANDYRYNSTSGDYRCIIKSLSDKYPLVRLSTFTACNPSELAFSIRGLTRNNETERRPE